MKLSCLQVLALAAGMAILTRDIAAVSVTVRMAKSKTAGVAETSLGKFTIDAMGSGVESSITTGALAGMVMQYSSVISTASLELRLTRTSPEKLVAQTYEVEVINRGLATVGIGSLSIRELSTAGPIYTRLLTNGRMYHDPGQLYDLTEQAKPVDSFFNAALYAPETSHTLVIGYLDARHLEPHIRTIRTSKGETVEAEAIASSQVELAPGQSLRSGPVLLLFGENPFETLEKYADILAEYHAVRLNPIINGWCTWFPMYGNVSEEAIMRNARVIAKELKPYGMDWVQIDDGYQRAFGDWRGDPHKLPAGMKDMAQKITSLGLKPGLWMAPFAVSRNTELATSHPEWLVHTPDGKLQDIEAAHQQQAQYILDVSTTGAREWLHDTLHTIVRDWGYKFIKTDFSEWTLLATQRFADPSWSTAKAYHAGNATMRAAMGADIHLLDCGPTPEIIGIADSMRIELDRPTPENNLWDQYVTYYNSTAPAVAKRYYFHGRTWINDADHIRLIGLDIPQAQVAATITALSGGTMISGDHLDQLDPERMSILKKVIPSTGKCARPIDLFETTQPQLFVCPFSGSAGEWTVAGIFNWSDTTRTQNLSRERLGFKRGVSCLAFDFWNERLLYDGSDDIVWEQAPRSVTLLSIRPLLAFPQVVGTNRHVMQGEVELSHVEWDETARKLSGKANGAAGMSYDIFIYEPHGFTAQSAEGATLEPGVDSRVRKLHLAFTREEAREWRVRF